MKYLSYASEVHGRRVGGALFSMSYAYQLYGSISAHYIIHQYRVCVVVIINIFFISK